MLFTNQYKIKILIAFTDANYEGFFLNGKKKRTGNHMIKSPKLFNFILMSIWFLYVNSCEVDQLTLSE